jgi:hypothetical protein
MRSFHNDPALKAGVVRRLQAHAAAGDVLNAPTHWRDGKGSPAACMVDDGSLVKWQERLGIPKAIGSLVDTIAMYSVTPEGAAQFAQDWLAAVPVGRDLHGIANALVIWILADPAQGVVHCASSDIERSMIDRVTNLHRQGFSGEKPAAATWRAARVVAMAATDGFASDIQKAVGRAVEAAAWDPVTTATVLSDTGRSWIAAHLRSAVDGSGWTEADDRATHARLKDLFEEAKRSGAGAETINVFALLEQHHPDEATRLREKNTTERRIPAACATALGARLMELTGAASYALEPERAQ